jgi:hypothetical protein
MSGAECDAGSSGSDQGEQLGCNLQLCERENVFDFCQAYQAERHVLL